MAQVDGFTPRGTPMATRINTGINMQEAVVDKHLSSYPLASCQDPPVQLWMAVCSSGNAKTAAIPGTTLDEP